MYGCIYVRMYVRMYVCMYVCSYVGVQVCVCVQARMDGWMDACVSRHTSCIIRPSRGDLARFTNCTLTSHLLFDPEHRWTLRCRRC